MKYSEKPGDLLRTVLCFRRPFEPPTSVPVPSRRPSPEKPPPSRLRRAPAAPYRPPSEAVAAASGFAPGFAGLLSPGGRRPHPAVVVQRHRLHPSVLGRGERESRRRRL
ncbi:hypothetical protein NL676_009388 [Syzygium grande]|nr:hypothetical protein NL676_009388 [Syzygium grande]